MQFIMGILLLGVIIAFHEFGHFMAAKLSGIGVTEFSLGMGPPLWQRRRGDTVYSLRAIPLGGYCAMFGEPTPEASVQTEKDAGRRKKCRVSYKQDWRPEQSFTHASKWKQIFISLAGPGANFLMAFLAAVCLMALPGVPMGAPEIVVLGPVSVAEDAGVKVGDVVVSINDQTVASQQDFSTYMALHPEVKSNGYTMGVYRPDTDERLSFYLIPDEETGLVGIHHRGQALPGGLSIRRGWTYMTDTVQSSCGSLAALVQGKLGLKDMSGIVGITAGMGTAMGEAVENQTGETDYSYQFALLSTVLQLTVLVSIGLAVANLLPLPALDGGRTVIALGEMIFRKNMPEQAALKLNLVGMLFLCGLMLIVTVSDLIRLIQPLFS